MCIELNVINNFIKSCSEQVKRDAKREIIPINHVHTDIFDKIDVNGYVVMGMADDRCVMEKNVFVKCSYIHEDPVVKFI